MQTGESFEDKLSYLSASPFTHIPIRLSAVNVNTTAGDDGGGKLVVDDAIRQDPTPVDENDNG
jgi:hypothetical protein